jgi:hypothetical protein
MTTFTKPSHFSAARHHAATDFVSSDSAALASHMSRCADGRSRFFGLRTVFESAHSLVFSRMVTCALIAVAAVGMLGLVGMV